MGLALGGGSARGIAHVGVIRWFEEHRIPIDVVAGTSMGGLIGGAFASGMDAGELHAFIASLDWDRLFGASSFVHKNIRRKADARAYPSRLEFGVKGGLVAPAALNNGESVELLFGRVAAPYFDVDDFDDLPTPFRAVAVDLLTAQTAVIRSGFLADALRATMSLPLVFPPVDLQGQLLVDGGAINNVPADVVKATGVDRVIAVNVGNLSDREGVSFTMAGVAGDTLDAMMRASTRTALSVADVVIDVPLGKYGSLDWRRFADLIEEGYRAADSARDRLLPLALSDSEYTAWRESRQSRRRTELPRPAFLRLKGFAADDARRLDVLLAHHLGTAVDVDALEHDLSGVAGLDRYETVTWRLVRDEAHRPGLLVLARVKPHAPPFMMLGLNVENTPTTDFRIGATGRYLAFDVMGSGSELRIDGAIGSDPSAGIALYRPVGRTPLFVAPYAGVGRARFDVVADKVVVARYRETDGRIGLDAGVNIGANSDVRIGGYLGRTAASIEVGNPGVPELRGKVSGADLVWRLDTQDSPVVPAVGLRSEVRVTHIFSSPGASTGGEALGFDTSLTQLSAAANRFWSVGPQNRVFLYGAVGTSFDATPFPTHQFALGAPFRLGAYNAGEVRGPHYYVATGGYLRQVGRLPDFLGGSVFAGGWIENGDAFERWADASVRTNGGAGMIVDTLVGPVVLAGSWSFDGRWRAYLGVGRTFR